MEGLINKLFEGHIQKSITCLHVPYKSTKRDAYMDIFLDVRGCKNIYDSFDRLTAKERMEGDNQYNAEGYGMQVRIAQGSTLKPHRYPVTPLAHGVTTVAVSVIVRNPSWQSCSTSASFMSVVCSTAHKVLL